MIPGLIDTPTEAVIAELTDNSLENQATKVRVHLYGNRWDDFGIIVLDNGLGFETRGALEGAFRLAVMEYATQQIISKTHIGMKLAPLSICNTVSVYTKIDGSIETQRLDRKEVKEARQYGSSSSEEESDIAAYAKEMLSTVDEIGGDSSEWTTAVVMSDFTTEEGDVRPAFGLSANEAGKKKYINHLCHYLGIVYQEFLESLHPQILLQHLKVTTEKDDETTHSQMVNPLDPFWSSLTPDKINRRLELPESNPDGITASNRLRMECIREFGTIATSRVPVSIRLSNYDVHTVFVTGYVIPPNFARKSRERKIPAVYTKGMIDVGPKRTGSDSLRSGNMGGFFFYRNGRCICFGNTGNRSKGGWYDLADSVRDQYLVIRFKLEFTPELDNYMSLSPNKDKVRPPPEFFEKVMDALQVRVYDRYLRGGLGEGDRAFYLSNEDDTGARSIDTSCLSAVSVTGTRNPHTRAVDCSHCDGFHHRDTRCPEEPCDVCSGECVFDEDSGSYDCTYVCEECGRRGEHQTAECPNPTVPEPGPDEPEPDEPGPDEPGPDETRAEHQRIGEDEVILTLRRGADNNIDEIRIVSGILDINLEDISD